MNAWTHDLGELKVRSVALPSDGGVLEPATERHGRYKVSHVDVAATIARERRRLKLAAEIEQQERRAAALPGVLPWPTRGRR